MFFSSRVLSCLKLEMNRFLGKLQARVHAIAAVMNMQHFFLYIFKTFNAVALLINLDVNVVVQCLALTQSAPPTLECSPLPFYFHKAFF